MFKKKPLTPADLMNDDARRAQAEKEIARTIVTYVAVKVGVSLLIAGVAYAVAKKLDAAEN